MSPEDDKLNAQYCDLRDKLPQKVDCLKKNFLILETKVKQNSSHLKEKKKSSSSYEPLKSEIDLCKASLKDLEELNGKMENVFAKSLNDLDGQALQDQLRKEATGFRDALIEPKEDKELLELRVESTDGFLKRVKGQVVEKRQMEYKSALNVIEELKNDAGFENLCTQFGKTELFNEVRDYDAKMYLEKVKECEAQRKSCQDLNYSDLDSDDQAQLVLSGLKPLYEADKLIGLLTDTWWHSIAEIIPVEGHVEENTIQS